MRNSDLSKVREYARMFLYLDFDYSNEFSPKHPFTSTWKLIIPETREFIDLRKEDQAEGWRCLIEIYIENSTLFEIFYMITNPYKLQFLKYVSKYLSDSDLGRVLSISWTRVEYISCDTSLSSRTILSWFNRANKDTLMDAEENKVFDSLPETVTIYRGVTAYNRKKKKAFSWTLSYDTAKWFANRFSTRTGEIWKMSIPKARILAYFSDCNEQEVIVNLYGDKELEKNIQVEKV